MMIKTTKKETTRDLPAETFNEKTMIHHIFRVKRGEIDQGQGIRIIKEITKTIGLQTTAMVVILIDMNVKMTTKVDYTTLEAGNNIEIMKGTIVFQAKIATADQVKWSKMGDKETKKATIHLELHIRIHNKNIITTPTGK